MAQIGALALTMAQIEALAPILLLFGIHHKLLLQIWL